MNGEFARASNALTARWAWDACDGTTTALSGAGAWPLLALLSAAAREPGRAELQQAADVDAAHGDRHAREALGVFGGGSAASAALGVWAHAGLPVEPWWEQAVPPTARGELTGDPASDQPRLDAWVRQNTAGRLTRLPVKVEAETALALATALSIDTRWRQPFEDVPLTPREGPWSGRGREAAGLRVITEDVDRLAMAESPAGPLTLMAVPGEDDIDVYLCMGEPRRPANEVLAHAVAAADGHYRLHRGDELRKRSRARKVPGLRVLTYQSMQPQTKLNVTTARFDITAEHDLLARPGLFGLGTVSTPDPHGHFPGISRTPLAIAQARQDVTATFSAEGFKAAAVTAMTVMVTGAAMNEAHMLYVTFDRPFGFLARHRPTGLVLLAGWVADPQDWPDDVPTTPSW